MLTFSCRPRKGDKRRAPACRAQRGAGRPLKRRGGSGRGDSASLETTGARERNELLPPPDAHCGTRPHAANFHSPPHPPPPLTPSHRGPEPLGRRNAEAAREPKRHGRDDIWRSLPSVSGPKHLRNSFPKSSCSGPPPRPQSLEAFTRTPPETNRKASCQGKPHIADAITPGPGHSTRTGPVSKRELQELRQVEKPRVPECPMSESSADHDRIDNTQGLNRVWHGRLARPWKIHCS